MDSPVVITAVLVVSVVAAALTHFVLVVLVECLFLHSVCFSDYLPTMLLLLQLLLNTVY